MYRYFGESPAKKLARAYIHSMVRVQLEGAFYSYNHLAFASKECGDAAVLAGLNVPGERVFLAEIDHVAAEEAWSKLTRGETLVEGDVQDSSFSGKFPLRSFAHVFLDFCGSLTPDVTSAAYRIARDLLIPGGILTVAISYGRSDTKHLASSRRMIKTLSSALGESQCDREMIPAIERLVALEADLNERARRFCIPILFASRGHMAYRGGGMPMAISQMIVPRAPEEWSWEEWNSKANGIFKHLAWMDRAIRFPNDQKELIRQVLLYDRENRERGVGDKPHLVFNISDGTLRAWKNWATRGKYGEIKRRHPMQSLKLIETQQRSTPSRLTEGSRLVSKYESRRESS